MMRIPFTKKQRRPDVAGGVLVMLGYIERCLDDYIQAEIENAHRLKAFENAEVANAARLDQMKTLLGVLKGGLRGL